MLFLLWAPDSSATLACGAFSDHAGNWETHLHLCDPRGVPQGPRMKHLGFIPWSTFARNHRPEWQTPSAHAVAASGFPRLGFAGDALQVKSLV